MINIVLHTKIVQRYELWSHIYLEESINHEDYFSALTEMYLIQRFCNSAIQQFSDFAILRFCDFAIERLSNCAV